MLRKISLAAVSCLALVALGALAPSAFATDIIPDCATNGLSSGIYPLANPTPGAKGTFRLEFTGSAGQPGAVSGDALLCGAKDDNKGNDTGFFYQNAIITVTGLGTSGLKIKCGRPAPVPLNPCDLNGDGQITPDENIADGTYGGSGIARLWCDDNGIFLCQGGSLTPPAITKNKFRYSESDCVDSATRIAIACQKAETTVLGFGCKANVTTYAVVGLPKTIQYKIGSPKCTGLSPVYVGTIDDISVCQYYGVVEGSACGDNSDPTKWTFKNGVGNWRANASAVLQQIDPSQPGGCTPGPGGHGRTCTGQRAANGGVATGTW